MKRLYLDIEALPAGEDSLEALKMVYGKKLQRYENVKTTFEDFHRSTSFEGDFGRILCIGYAANDDPVEVIYEEENELKMLEQFWNLARDTDLFIGHNIIDYDMRFIMQRSMMLNIKPSRNDISFARYRCSPMYDTMREWSQWSMRSIGLERLALAMGFPTPKEDIDGSQVYDFYTEGKVDEILEYCKRDVETTRAIYKRMTFQ